MTISSEQTLELVARFANKYVTYVNENGIKLADHVRDLNGTLSDAGKFIFTQLECNHTYYLNSLEEGKYNFLVYLRNAKDGFLRHTNEAIQKYAETIEKLENGSIPACIIRDEINAILNNNKARIFAEGDDIILEVETDKIILKEYDESVCLNEMLIQFSLEGKDIRVKAKEPVFANGCFHPHVSQDGDVCEGAGEDAITGAMESGRLVDLFDIVSSLLHTYNPRSPYVGLHEWLKEPMACWECGYDDLDEDNSYCCEHRNCEHTLCEECRQYCIHCSSFYCSDHMSDIPSLCLGCYNDTATCSVCDTRVESYTTCDDCGETICYDCSYTCDDCQDNFCRSCLEECHTCGDLFCKKCLAKDIDNAILCLKCELVRKEAEKEEDE